VALTPSDDSRPSGQCHYAQLFMAGNAAAAFAHTLQTFIGEVAPVLRIRNTSNTDLDTAGGAASAAPSPRP
jgi:hypothetical protein